MVGHTHEDIDQTFSCLSRYLRKHDAVTMPGKYSECFYQPCLVGPNYIFIVIKHCYLAAEYYLGEYVIRTDSG